MRNYSPSDRVNFYALSDAAGRKWPDSIPWLGKDGRIYGMWMLGQDYRSKSGYYGSYPPNFLTRIFALFPDAKHSETLHLFSGSLPEGTLGRRIDINPKTKPDIVGDAHDLQYVMASRLGRTRLIIADPPYSVEDAEHYGTCMIRRNVVLQQCARVLECGGWLVWLDQVLPMFRKSQLELAGAIGIIRSTNHRFRVVTLFRRKLRVKVKKIAA